MGTSVGTITLITPIALAVSTASGFAAPLCVGAVMGGAMFGDNLSFISDTTIAACNGQGCAMKDKFRANFKIALPAALVTLAIIFIRTSGGADSAAIIKDYNLIDVYKRQPRPSPNSLSLSSSLADRKRMGISEFSLSF